MVDTNRNDDRDRRDAAAAAAGTRRWLPWIIGAIALLMLILALRSCGDDDRGDTEAVTADSEAMIEGVEDDSAAMTGTAGEWNGAEFTRYLGGSDPVGRTFALDRVTFASGSSLVRNEAQGQIAEVAAALRARPTARVSLRGYADPEGDAAANQELSQTRTQAVRNALIKAGAREEQIVAASALGETGSSATEANRRVEITVTAR